MIFRSSMISGACCPDCHARVAGELLISPFLRPAAVVISRVSRPSANSTVAPLGERLNSVVAFARHVAERRASTCLRRQLPYPLRGIAHYQRSVDLRRCHDASAEIVCVCVCVQCYHKN